MTAAGPPSPRTALFLCEDLPVAGLSGPASYNRTILNALGDLGYQVDVHVTSPRLHLLDGRLPPIAGARRTGFVHARLWRGRLIPSTIPSILRTIKHRVLRRGRASANSAAGAPGGAGVARIGRRLGMDEVRRLARQLTGRAYDIVLIDTVFRAPGLGAIGGSPRTVLVAHDIFCERARSFHANGFRVVSSVTAAEEKAIWSSVDAIAAISDSDAALVAATCATPVAAIYPVVDAAQPARPAGTDILYIGTAAYHNVDGLQWFLSDIWPAVRASKPDAQLKIVGSIAVALGDLPDGVTALGRVDDLGAVAATCGFAINPVRMGSGIKIKMVDYFQLGLPCVVTPLGAEGFPQAPRPPFRTAEHEPDFADAIIDWLARPGDVLDHAAAIPDYLRRFSRAAARDALSGLLGGDGKA